MVEQVAGKVNEEDAMRSMKRVQAGKFNFTDFLDQMKIIQNLDPLEGMLGLMPGFSKIKNQLPSGAFDTKKNQTHRSHRAFHDPHRAPAPGDHQRLPPPTHRRRFRHLIDESKSADQAVRRDA
jgi:hypothetical protein